MNNIFAVAAFFFSAVFTIDAHAQGDQEWDGSRSLDMRCDYSDYNTFQFESATLLVAKQPLADQASQQAFTKGRKDQQHAYHQLISGKQAECVFPSGNQVRVKVGEGSARPYGMCGGDPEVFVSIWVNRRKIASRIWFGGRCMDYEENFPELSFQITGGNAGDVTVEQCGTSRHLSPEEPLNGAKSETHAPIKICVKYPDARNFPIDVVEYPSNSTQKEKPGAIVQIAGTHAVCKAALQELRDDINTFSKYPNQTAKLRRPEWDSPSVALPDEFINSSESIFDFDNDGTLDRVLVQSQENTYSDGNVLLVQPGTSKSRLLTSESVLDTVSRFLPCQMDKIQHPIEHCPLFSQKADDAGFWMQGKKGRDKVYFRARYTALAPFDFHQTNYLGVSSVSVGAENYVGVLKPLPGNKFQQMCLFRQVSENY